MLVASFTPQTIAIVVVLLLLFFNRKKLPGMARDLGKSLRKTKQSFNEHQERQAAKAEIVDAQVVREEDVTQAPRPAEPAARERDEL